MTIRIQTEELYIPVEFGSITLKFPIDDDSLVKLEESWKEVTENIKDKSDTVDIEEQKALIRQAYDFLFEEGTFDKVYELVPSTMMLLDYFVEISVGIRDELEERNAKRTSKHEEISKYLKKKK